MALTLTQPDRCKDNAGIRSRRVYLITGPPIYAAIGESLTPNALSLGVVEYISLPPCVVNAGGAAPLLPVYGYTNQRLHFFVPSTGLEVAAGQDLSGYTFRVEAIGK